MGMAEKKERGRFSIRFNAVDPIHRAAVELLELQPPHCKAQYIANAVVYYNEHFSSDPQPIRGTAIDKASIEAVVLEILRREKELTANPPEPPHEPVEKKASKVQAQTSHPKDTDEVDEVTLGLIADTLASFRGGK